MNNPPAASVIIPVLNGEKTIGVLLAALKNQAGVGEFEIIVVDNGSTDRSMEIARAADVTVLQQPVRGPSAARNMGLQHARAEILAYADSDTIPSRRWLASLLAAFADPNVIIASGPILGWQPVTAAERYCSVRAAYARENTIDHPLHAYAPGMSLAVRRKNALEISGWDESMTSGEDVDFCCRLRLRFGNKIHFVEEAVLFHQHRCTDEALWRQARWHGAGYALFHNRHSNLLSWTAWNFVMTYLTIGILYLMVPVIAFARSTGLMNAQRAEFERYHRLWTRYFWAGFFEQRKKLSA
jgi:glycosyltransferase involved in cell wall biosynthesis